MTRLRIAIDATPLGQGLSGVGFYTLNLISALHQLQGQEQFSLIVAYQPSMKKWLRGQWSEPALIQHYPDRCVIPIPIRLVNSLATFPNPILPFFERKLGQPDIIHGTNSAVYPCRKSLKVLSLYDLTFFKYPEYTSLVIQTFTQRVRHCLKWTDLVVTISESSKQDIVEFLHVDPDRVWVTPLASRYSEKFPLKTTTPTALNAPCPDRFSPYILFVSTIEPRKNIITLVQAFNHLKQTQKIPHQLVLAGAKGWKYQPIFEAIAASPWQSEIHHLDYLPDNALAAFYQQADVFVYPSYYEGFGLPVLEAMTLGAPVVAANVASIPEVTGDAAVLVDPKEPLSLAEGILQVIGYPEVRHDLIQKGRTRAAQFSWERTAQETLRAYRSRL